MATEAKATLLVQLKDLVSDGIQKIGDKVKDLGEQLEKSKYVFASAFGGIVAAIGLSLAEFGQEELAVKSLAQALANQGAASKETIKGLQEYAAELQRVSKFSDDSILSMQTQLVSYGLTGNKLKEVTKLTLDLASAKQIDLSTAANLVGKAFVGETAMLSRYGIIIDENLPLSQKFSEVLRQINDRFGGQAMAQRQTFIGQMDSIKNVFGDFLETIGSAFAPIIGKAADLLGELLARFTTLSPEVKTYIVIATAVALAFTGIITAVTALTFALPAFGAALTVATGPIGIITVSLIGLSTIVYVLTQSFDELGRIAGGVLQGLSNSMTGFGEAMSLLFEGKMSEAWQRFKDAAADALIAVGGGIGEMTTVAFDEGQKQFNALMDLVNQKANLYNQDVKNSDAASKKRLAIQMSEQQKMKELAELEKLTTVTLEDMKLKERNKLEEEDYKHRTEGANNYRQFMIGAVNSQHTALKAVAKVFLIQQTIMDTQAAAMGAYNALSRIPFVGPALGAAAAAAAIAYGAERVATIASMAEGGLVMPTPGGTIARIGEAGSREAVIPLDDPNTKEAIRDTLGGGGQTVIEINAGVIVADDLSLTKLTKIIDEKLYELKKNREAISI